MTDASAVDKPKKRATLRHSGTAPQMAFWRSKAKYRAYVGGVGSGKTRASVIEMLRQPAGSVGMAVAPTYDMVMLGLWSTMLEVAEPFIASVNKQEMKIVLINGTTIYFRSADRVNRLRGVNLSWFTVDEACYCDEEVWKILIARLRRKDVTGAWITTTPKGFDWVWRLFVESPTKDFELIRSRTADNVYLPADYVGDLERQYSSAFSEQELNGEFINLGDSIIQRGWFKYSDPPKNKRLPISIGVDVAYERKTINDYTALVVSAYDAETGSRYVLDVIRDRLSQTGIENLIIQTAEKWSNTTVGSLTAINIEATAAQRWLVQKLRERTDLPVKGINHGRWSGDKVQRFQPVIAQLENGLLHFSKGLPSYFEEELITFPTEGKNIFDDCVDALQLSLAIPTRRAIRLMA